MSSIMQNLSSAFPQLMMPNQRSPPTTATSTTTGNSDGTANSNGNNSNGGSNANNLEQQQQFQLPPELQMMLAASGDQGGIFNNLLAYQQQQHQHQQQQQHHQRQGGNGSPPGPTPADFAQLLLAATGHHPNQPQPPHSPHESAGNGQQQQQQLKPTPDTTDLNQLLSFFSNPNPVGGCGVTNEQILDQMQLLNSLQVFGLPPPNGLNMNGNGGGSNGSSGGGGSSPNVSSLGGPSNGYTSPSKDSYCELCDKTFCNRYFLRTHKAKKHGIIDENFSTPIKGGPVSQVTKMESSSSPPLLHGIKEEGRLSPMEDVANGKMVHDIQAMLAAVQNAQTTAEGTQPEFLALLRQFTKTAATPVKSPEPQVEMKPPTNMIPRHHSFSAGQMPPNGPTAQQQAQSMLGMLPHGFPALPFMLPQMPGAGGFGGFSDMESSPTFNSLGPISQLTQSMSGGVMNGNKSTPSKKQYSSTTKNYCDICHKEVCNKYFLRTHMLKMHNIVIDENKTVIANIDTQEKEREGSVSFRCDLCSAVLKTRQELRDHKHTSHGIQPLITTTPGGSQLSRASSVGSKPPSANNSASGSSTFEFPPMLSSATSSNSPPAELPLSSSSAISSTTIKCTKCDSDLPDVSGLLEHIKNDHGEDFSVHSVVEMIAKASSASTSGMPNADGTDDEAMEVTREVALKMAAQNCAELGARRSSSGAMKSPKPFGCGSCHRAYTSKKRLDDHVATVHQYKLKMSPKKPNQLILSPSKINKKIKCFTCSKCNIRFASSTLCLEHIIQHIKSDQRLDHASDEAAAAAQTTPTVVDDNMEHDHETAESTSAAADEVKENKNVFDDTSMIARFMLEESFDGHDDAMDCDMDGQDRNRLSVKLPEEKHSHTSGTASPVSVHTIPEVFAQPSSVEKKAFVLQSFVMRQISSDDSDGTTTTDNLPFANELRAYMPVRSPVDTTIRVLFELRPTPEIDAQIKNL